MEISVSRSKMDVRKSLSQRGKPVFTINSYIFKKDRILATGETGWRCSTGKCKAHVETLGNCENLSEHFIIHSHDALAQSAKF